MMTLSAQEHDTAEDLILLQLIASSLQRLAQAVATANDQDNNAGRSLLPYPYPPPVQRTINRTAHLAFQRGHPPISGLLDLLQLARQPLVEWPFLVEATKALMAPGDVLLGGPDGSITTWLCSEWARLSPDVEELAREERFMHQVFVRKPPDATYTAFRRLLIERPALTEDELATELDRPVLQPLAKLVREAYTRAGRAYEFGGVYLTCRACGNLLLPDAQRRPYCDDETCGAGTHPEVGRTLRGLVCWLAPELRKYITAPGRTEVTLAEQLGKLPDVVVDLWPALDRFDLRITFASGMVWAIDVKDWASPFALAHRAEAIPLAPIWDHAFFVFPRVRRKQRPGYREAFLEFARERGIVVRHDTESLPPKEKTGALYDDQLLALARRHAATRGYH